MLRRDRERGPDDAPGLISASRRVEAPSRHRRDSCPSHNEVGGFFFDFEAIRTASSEYDAPRRESKKKGLDGATADEAAKYRARKLKKDEELLAGEKARLHQRKLTHAQVEEEAQGWSD